MTYFLTREYFLAVAPLVIVLLGALVRRWERAWLALALATVVMTWPPAAGEGFSRAWAHDWLTGAAMVGLLVVAAVRGEPLAHVFAAMVCVGANEALLLVCGGRASMALVVGAGALLLAGGSGELGAGGYWPLILLPALAVAGWRASALERAAFSVAALRIAAVVWAPADFAWRFGILK